MFSEKYYWFIVSLNDDVFRFLAKLNLNVNAELTVALRTNECWKIFEVYNQAARHGGRLSIKHLDNYNCTAKNVSLEFSKSKYFRRKNMTGVFFKSLIVVSNCLHTEKGFFCSNSSCL